MNDEIKELNDSITWWNNRFNAVQRDYEELKQENERLKEKSINEVLKNDFDMCVKDLKKASKKIEKLEDYKSRIEKAVEYINNNLLYSEDFDYDEEDNLVWQGARCDTQREDLLNILNGRSDKNE